MLDTPKDASGSGRETSGTSPLVTRLPTKYLAPSYNHWDSAGLPRWILETVLLEFTFRYKLSCSYETTIQVERFFLEFYQTESAEFLYLIESEEGCARVF